MTFVDPDLDFLKADVDGVYEDDDPDPHQGNQRIHLISMIKTMEQESKNACYNSRNKATYRIGVSPGFCGFGFFESRDQSLS